MNEKFQLPPQSQVNEFIAILKYFGLFQPESLYKCICPFHADKNASMQINIPKAFFFCYGCNASGSTLELYKYFQQKNGRKINELQCLKEIKEICKSEKVKSPLYNNIYNIYNNKENNSFVDSKINYKEGISQAKEFYKNLPTPNWYKPGKVQAIEEETRQCKAYMKKRGYSTKLLVECEAKPSLNKNYPIVIPLLENEIFRGYVMRTFDKEIEQQRKYMYNRGFKRVLCLPGRFKKEMPILLVEGYLDCLAAIQFGIKYSAAILGWKISSEQVQKLKRKRIKKIVCGLDNDEAGRKGYKYLQRIGKLNNFSVERIRYPKGIKDFGDLLKNEEKAKTVLEQCKKFGLI